MDGIRGVFFDLHGTILISDDLSKAWNEWLEAFHGCMVKQGLTISRKEFQIQVNNLFERPEPEFNAPGMSVFERRIMEFSRRHDLKIDREYLRWMVDYIIGVWYRDMYIDHEARGVIKALKPLYRTALITNWDHAPWIHRWLNEFSIGDWFEEVVISDEMRLEPQEMVYVGDSQEDVKGTLAVGAKPILIKRVSSEDPLSPFEDLDRVIVINQLSELLEIFKK
jgi:FMN phosphatase YigB (HAD superfamily)